MECPEPEYGVSDVQDGRAKISGRMGFLEILQIGQWVVGGSEVNCQLLFRSTRLKPMDTIWMDSVEPKDGII